MNRINKRVVGSAKRYLCHAAKHCNNIQCRYAEDINEALYLLALTCVDMGKPIPLHILPEKVRARIMKYSVISKILEYYRYCSNCGEPLKLLNGAFMCPKCNFRVAEVKIPEYTH